MYYKGKIQTLTSVLKNIKQAFYRVITISMKLPENEGLKKGVLATVLSLYVIIVIPGTYSGSRSGHELWTFSMDDRSQLLPPMIELVQGKIPQFRSYGHFPEFFSAALFLPFIVTHKIKDKEISYLHHVMMLRLSQVFMALLCFYVLYKMALLCMSFWYAIGAVVIAMLSNTLYEYVFYIHPDVFQMTTFVIATYLLMKFLQRRRIGYFLGSAILAGCATGSKYWGFFILPSVLVCLISFYKEYGIAKIMRLLCVYILIIIIVFLITNPHFIFHFDFVIEKYKKYQAHAAPINLSGFSELLDKKISLFTSPYYFGSLFFIFYIISLLVRINQACKEKWKLHAYDFIHINLITLIIFYFVVFNDKFNVPAGERYLLAWMIPLPIVVLYLFYQMLHSQSKGIRYVACLSSVVLILSLSLKVAGVPMKYFILGQGDLFHQKEVASLWDTIGYYYQKEDMGTFLMREWLTGNVERGSHIYVEAYMNINPWDETRDLPGYKISYDYSINPQKIPYLKPDYVFTKSKDLAQRIMKERPYTIIRVIGKPGLREVYVLKKVSAPRFS